jgi:hypothetical protein
MSDAWCAVESCTEDADEVRVMVNGVAAWVRLCSRHSVLVEPSEPTAAEIAAALEAVQHYYMLFGDLYGKSIRLSERTIREILTTALRAAVAARGATAPTPKEK